MPQPSEAAGDPAGFVGYIKGTAPPFHRLRSVSISCPW